MHTNFFFKHTIITAILGFQLCTGTAQTDIWASIPVFKHVGFCINGIPLTEDTSFVHRLGYDFKLRLYERTEEHGYDNTEAIPYLFIYESDSMIIYFEEHISLGFSLRYAIIKCRDCTVSCDGELKNLVGYPVSSLPAEYIKASEEIDRMNRAHLPPDYPKEERTSIGFYVSHDFSARIGPTIVSYFWDSKQDKVVKMEIIYRTEW